jgi:hypothetical protein
VDFTAAFTGYATCDPRAEVEKESYLSAFTFGEDFRELLETTGSTKGFSGVCSAQWIWWDIDRENNLQAAIADARRLAVHLDEHYLLNEDLLIFFSGSKGFHVGLPTCLWNPPPSSGFNKIARKFAETVVERIGIATDCGVYDKVRAFRAPNSRHPKTGLFKRYLTLDELRGLSLEGVLMLAATPEPFEFETSASSNGRIVADWEAVADMVANEQVVCQQRVVKISNGDDHRRLNRTTLEFIRNGASEGDRHRLLYSAARNLADFNCPSDLAHGLLTDAGRDCGLAPREVRRQIDCGLRDGGADDE